MNLTKQAMMNTSFGSLHTQVNTLSKLVESMRMRIIDLEDTIAKIKRDVAKPTTREMEAAPSRLSEDDYSSEEEEIHVVPPPPIRHIPAVPTIRTRRRTSYVMVPKTTIEVSDYSDSDSDCAPSKAALEEL